MRMIVSVTFSPSIVLRILYSNIIICLPQRRISENEQRRDERTQKKYYYYVRLRMRIVLRKGSVLDTNDHNIDDHRVDRTTVYAVWIANELTHTRHERICN